MKIWSLLLLMCLGVVLAADEPDLSPAEVDDLSTYFPQVRYAPIYPAEALDKNLDGYVEFSFTVQKDGTLRDVVVTESSDKVFEAAATRAVKMFRYAPRLENGVIVETPGMTLRITFLLEE
ncbi:MAG: energy transducer TonB [Pseudomonadota bacterium]